MKAEIKRLSRAIDKVLHDNAEANYYNGLIDGGEWSQSGPNFDRLIKQFELTREKLNTYINFAEEMAREFNKKYPGKKPEILANPWLDIIINMHSIFMAGYLKRKHKPSVQFGIYPDGHRPIN